MPEQTRALLTWHEGMRFVARSQSGHGLIVESPGRDGNLGAGPMELMLIGLAGCTAIDVVSILTKMRESVEGLEVEIVGDRAEHHPKYYTSLEFVYRIKGRVAREKAERAVELSHSTYCSALASMRPDCQVHSRIELNGGEGAGTA